jgi:hypothetical protein
MSASHRFSGALPLSLLFAVLIAGLIGVPAWQSPDCQQQLRPLQAIHAGKGRQYATPDARGLAPVMPWGAVSGCGYRKRAGWGRQDSLVQAFITEEQHQLSRTVAHRRGGHAACLSRHRHLRQRVPNLDDDSTLSSRRANEPACSGRPKGQRLDTASDEMPTGRC